MARPRSTLNSTSKSGAVSVVAGIEEGNRLPSVPKVQVAASATYQRQMMQRALGYLTATFQHVGSRLTQIDDHVAGVGTVNLLSFAPNTIGGPLTASTFTFDPVLPAYDILNLRLGVLKGNWDVALFASNVTDERAFLALDRERGTRARVGYLTNQRRLVLEEDVDRDLVPEAAREATAAANPAAGARLSLDLDLSRLAKAALEDARGSVVLLDPHTGSVLAAVSDSVTLQTGGTPAFEDRREPASISKIVTTAAAMRAGIDPDAFLKRLECRGATRIGRGTVWCSYPAGPLEGLDHALAVSCNMAFAHLGLEVGRAALLDELARWGFGRDFAPWAPGGRVLQPAGDPRQLADLAIGLEATDLTPLHGALLAAVVGNDGHMPEPVLIEGESGPLSLAWHPPPRAPARDVIDRAAVKVLTRAMVAVAVRGTAAGVAPRDFPVAMKTGTGAEWRRGYHANYVGVAPWPNPVVAFSVRVTHEPTSARVNRTARLVLGRLLEALRRNLCAPDAPPQGLTATWRWKPEGSRSRPLVCS